MLILEVGNDDFAGMRRRNHNVRVSSDSITYYAIARNWRDNVLRGQKRTAYRMFYAPERWPSNVFRDRMGIAVITFYAPESEWRGNVLRPQKRTEWAGA